MEQGLKYELVRIRGQQREMLLVDYPPEEESMPKGMYSYDIRHDGEGTICSIEERVAPAMRWGTLISNRPVRLTHNYNGYEFLPVCDEQIIYLGKKMTLAEYMIEFVPDLDYAEMNYSQFCVALEDPDTSFEVVLEYTDFVVYKDDATGRYFYMEVSEVDADEFFEVYLVAELVYDVNHNLQATGEMLSGCFRDIVCCGESVSDNSIRYLWFSDKKHE